MKVWNQAPLVRLILPFLAGILLAVCFPFPNCDFLWLLALIFCVVAGFVLIPKFSGSYRRSFLFGCILNLLLILLGYQLTLFKTQKYSPQHFSNYVGEGGSVRARLSDAYVKKERSLKLVLEILAVEREQRWIAASGKALVYVEIDSLALQLRYGDELILQTEFKEVQRPLNPGAFDYKRFLFFQNIYHQAYLKKHDWRALNRNSGNMLMFQSIRLRDHLLGIFEKYELGGDELSVGAALLLGYTDKLDAELVTAYSSSGAMHVLSVSGLHVAIVYVVFSWLLFFLNKNKSTRVLKALLLLLFLWFYAALTGLSPSVLRAATMFSFIVVAKATDRHTNIYNTLAASAFLLLLTDPFLIMDVGFQLSYLAVIGIVYLQPRIYEVFEFDNWLLNQSWNVTAVSIAAQVATFPLGLYYFHQFPNYFLLSNLIVIPVSTLIIYVGIALLAFSQIPVFAKYLALAFSWLIWLLNASVKWIDGLPFSLLEGISISVFETILLYVVIVLLLFYFSEKKYKFLLASLVVFAILILSQLVEQQQQLRQRRLIVYNIPKTTAVDLICGKSNTFITDSAFAKNERALLFNVKPNWWERGLTTTKVVAGSRYLEFFDKRIFILDQDLKTERSTNVDYLIVSKNVKMTVAEMRTSFRVKTIVFDASNSVYRIKKWKEDCERVGQVYYSTIDSGALEIDL